MSQSQIFHGLLRHYLGRKFCQSPCWTRYKSELGRSSAVLPMSAPAMQDTEAILPAEQQVDGISSEAESGAVAGAAECALVWPNSDLYKESNCIS